MTEELSFTGERFHPDLAGEMWAEHWHRYHFVLPLIAGKKVLDVASGEGYGSALMATIAETVSGVDVSAVAVAHATAVYAEQANLRFAQGSCASLPCEDASVDVVVSFETIEHIHEQDEFLGEIRRVLKPAGLLIMSSPNRAEYSDARGYSNEFHVKELYREELTALLSQRFQHTRWFSQRNAFVSMSSPEIFPALESSLVVQGESMTLSKAQPDKLAPTLPALYFLVVASNDSASMDRVASRLSVFSDSEEWAYNDYRQIYRASRLGHEREAVLEARCAGMEAQIAALKIEVDTAKSVVPDAAPVPTASSWLGRLLKRLSG